MIVSNVRLLIHGSSYKEIVEKTEKKIADFLEVDFEDIESNVSFEYMMYEASNDGISAPVFSAEVSVRVKNVNG
jgi:hypothetical protein